MRIGNTDFVGARGARNEGRFIDSSDEMKASFS